MLNRSEEVFPVLSVNSISHHDLSLFFLKIRDEVVHRYIEDWSCENQKSFISLNKKIKSLHSQENERDVNDYRQYLMEQSYRVVEEGLNDEQKIFSQGFKYNKLTQVRHNPRGLLNALSWLCQRSKSRVIGEKL